MTLNCKHTFMSSMTSGKGATSWCLKTEREQKNIDNSHIKQLFSIVIFFFK